jgi:hypothetical protein
MLAWGATTSASPSGGEIVARLAGTPIHAEELALHLARHRALVAVHFQQKHGITLDDEAGWLKSHGGEVPREILRQRAMESCLRDKAIQILGAKHGVGRLLPFPGFAAHVESINQQRRAELLEGGQIHGPVRFTAWQLYRYEIDNMRLRLTQVLSPGASNDTGPAKVEAVVRELLESSEGANLENVP